MLRWRVRNNLPSTRWFCPIVVKTGNPPQVGWRSEITGFMRFLKLAKTDTTAIASGLRKWPRKQPPRRPPQWPAWPAATTSGLKPLGPGLAEWRIDWGPGIRIYVHQDGKDLIVLMGGSGKGGQQAEIKAAALLVTEYKQRKKAAAKAAAVTKALHAKDSSGSSSRRNIVNSRLDG